MTWSTGPLGTTGMNITRVGFGAWALGGADWAYSWGAQDDTDSIDAIRYAIEHGINWIDTAAAYGLGHSEEVVALALTGIAERDRPYVFTKGGLVWDRSNRSVPPRRVASPESIRVEVEQSLRRLRTDRIDLYQLHWPPDDGTPLEDYWGALLELQASGKIGAAGLSNHSVDQLELADKVGHVNTLQPPFSAINRSSAPQIAWCARHTTGVIVYSPMQSGLLTGSFTTQRAASLGEDDWRSHNPEFRGERLTRNLALADALHPIADGRGVSVAAVAVAWTLAWPGVTGAIVGARRADQVDGWLPATQIELTEQELTTIADAIATTGAGHGPTRPM
jgi:aryl-alcohol dehydrogenase-like predicted oxidoreductase